LLKRKLFEWVVTLQSTAGEIKEVSFKAYWSPRFEGVADSVAQAAAIQETLGGKRDDKGRPIVGWAGLTARLA